MKYLAWAFGIRDDELEAKARQSGYIAAVTIDRKHAAPSNSIMALPRYMVLSNYDIKAFSRMLRGVEVLHGKD